MDGSTDSSQTEVEIIFIRYVSEGMMKVRFVAAKNVPRGDAETVFLALKSALEVNLGEMWKDKLVGFGTDGAAVMLGSKKGLVARVKEELKKEFILAVHCSAHR